MEHGRDYGYVWEVEAFATVEILLVKTEQDILHHLEKMKTVKQNYFHAKITGLILPQGNYISWLQIFHHLIPAEVLFIE